ncbi:MAG: hypothetical protein HY905_12150 [Deltaproteobacteria bacterium]|nr:hypothetical protein [Deltaproteobacteria bacterium]
MNRKILWCVAIVGAMATVLSGISCGDDDVNPSDGGDVRDEGGGGDVADVVDEGGGGACPPTAISGGISTMRLRRLNVTLPEAMQGAVIKQLINGSMDDGSFIWLLRFEGIGTGEIVLETGSGQATGAADTYSFLPDPFLPDTMTMAEDVLDFSLTGDPIAELNVPMWEESTSYPAPPLLTLPLRELQISGTFSDDHLNIGVYDETAGDWIDGGFLEGKVTTADAQATVIDLLGMTLCGLVSGDVGLSGDPSDDCSEARHPWPQEPDTTVGTDPAYNFTGTIAASPVCIE